MRHVAIASIVFTLVASACDDSPTGPTTSGRVEAVIQDSLTGNLTVPGTLAGDVFASLWNGTRWVDMGSPNGITIPLQLPGRTTTIHGEVDAPIDSYNRVRMVFQGVTARLADDVSLPLGGSDHRVEFSVPVDSFLVQSDESLKRVIVFELQSHRWLTLSTLQSGGVEDAPLQAAVTASIRLENR